MTSEKLAEFRAKGMLLDPKYNRLGTIGDEMLSGVATDASGNVYVTGYFGSPSITFGTTTLTNNANNNGIGYAYYYECNTVKCANNCRFNH